LETDWLVGAAGFEPLHQEFVFPLASLLLCLHLLSLFAPHNSATCAALAVFFAGSGYAAFSQDRGMPPPRDTIFARKIMMGAIDLNMDEIETMLAPEGKLESLGGPGACRDNLDQADGIPAHVSTRYESMDGGSRSGPRDGYVRFSGCLDQFREFLSTSRRGF